MPSPKSSIERTMNFGEPVTDTSKSKTKLMIKGELTDIEFVKQELKLEPKSPLQASSINELQAEVNRQWNQWHNFLE